MASRPPAPPPGVRPPRLQPVSPKTPLRTSSSTSASASTSTSSFATAAQAPSPVPAPSYRTERRPSTAPSDPLAREPLGAVDDASAAAAGSQHLNLVPAGKQPAFTWVCLGVGGGPLESDCSCYIVKPAEAAWEEGYAVVEGGSWLGALTRVLEDDSPSSAFASTSFPHSSAALRAGYLGSFAHCFVITHAHLDHILGLVLGSASLPGKRAVWGLRATLENLLEVFNGKIWPKLASFKEDEPHTVYHLRSLESQSITPLSPGLTVLPFALSHGLNPAQPPAPPTPTQHLPGAGGAPLRPASYFNKRFSLPLSAPHFSSWGPMHSALPPLASASGERPTFTSPFAPERDSGATSAAAGTAAGTFLGATLRDHVSEESWSESGSNVPDSAGPMSAGYAPDSAGPASAAGVAPDSADPTSTGDVLDSAAGGMSASTSGAPSADSRAGSPGPGSVPLEARSESQGAPLAPLPGQSAALPLRRVGNGPPRARRPRTAQGSERHMEAKAAHSDVLQSETRASSSRAPPPRRVSIDRSPPALDSTAFFISNRRTGSDVLFFGDVEPDSISQSPRNRRVWQHAASRFVVSQLHAVFLECSFPAAHPTQFLYGHLNVSHLFDELRSLARCVVAERRRRDSLKRSGAFDASSSAPDAANTSPRGASGIQRARVPPPLPASPAAPAFISESELRGSLQGLTFIIIHVKTALFPSFQAADSTDESAAAGEAPAPDRPRIIDPRTMRERILQELREIEEEVQLGARFEMAQSGMRIEC